MLDMQLLAPECAVSVGISKSEWGGGGARGVVPTGHPSPLRPRTCGASASVWACSRCFGFCLSAMSRSNVQGRRTFQSAMRAGQTSWAGR